MWCSETIVHRLCFPFVVFFQSLIYSSRGVYHHRECVTYRNSGLASLRKILKSFVELNPRVAGRFYISTVGVGGMAADGTGNLAIGFLVRSPPPSPLTSRRQSVRNTRENRVAVCGHWGILLSSESFSCVHGVDLHTPWWSITSDKPLLERENFSWKVT